ncbi:hypothetical protein ASPWEDRAFT_460265 [Aspergillus wentii DTO 134E9]|uniref:DUF1760-domain-containing protein n=1 Tax=Aspergillus wentii DTO 134E9 TaxID=1073089 RepID=A0A1L9RRP6_ASPWE|nr:uncharacterized protein ASPWEDRAFT_460265 [Aspergillus wentii DTO 134E9]KAI9930416.1 hypothetical protein MW887_011170 [Aspergillus wentii]OJJ37574.1 hypothetical protein ASPWEDRAFT_460265 [Aspergillus wentii DTO 134E9]
MAEAEDVLIQALPPATDYLTYLTLLEYQLTSVRLPILHKVLQDETLTTNIGWDLVQLLLPMLPHSLECLQDIARLGNPREVILRVSEALMALQPEDDDTESEAEDTNALETQLKNTDIGDDDDTKSDEPTRPLPRHVVQFNCLLAMLSVLHTRIQTKYPSRFIATSLQAALEAYTMMPTSETTVALLEFFRDVSPSKRPAPPPRAASESSLLRVSEASAPDPEAEVQPSPSTNDDKVLVNGFLQFGLIELLKSYLLSFSGPMDPGMSWAIRLQEKMHPKSCIPGKQTQMDIYATTKELRERDMLMAKITALSRDLGLDDNKLLAIVSLPSENQPPPLDFDETPKKVEEIPLERHGCLLLLAARVVGAELFTSRQTTPIPVFPDLARLFSNFVGGYGTPEEVTLGQPQVLLDSLLTLTIFSTEKPINSPSDDTEFRNFVLELTACAARQSYSSIRRIPATVVHSHPSPVARFKLIRKVLEDGKLLTVKDSAIGWLKDEILSAQKSESTTSDSTNIFLDPHYFSVLFPALFSTAELLLNVSSEIVASWTKFSQTLTPSIHAALSLYYVLVSSSFLRERLQLEKTYVYFRNRFLEPLKSLCHAFEADLSNNGGDGRIEAAVGESMCEVGMARSVGLITHVLEQVEDAVGDAFVLTDAELQEPSADDIARVDAIRKETS